MNKVQEALQAAVELLKNRAYFDETYPPETMPLNAYAKVYLQCKSALAEVEKCEPVLFAVKDYVNCAKHFHGQTLCSLEKTDLHSVSLYSTPISKEWVGLSDDERLQVAEIDAADDWFFAVCEKIEAKLKQLNAEKG